MLCSKCKTDMFISRTGYFAEGDNSPSTPTKFFHKAYFACRNKECSAFSKEQEGAPTVLYSADNG